MLSRRTARVIAEAYTSVFAYTYQYWVASVITYSGQSSDHGVPVTTISNSQLYDFTFDHDLPAWLCNGLKAAGDVQSVKEYIMRLHTGETTSAEVEGQASELRRREGHELLIRLAEAMLNDWAKINRPENANASISAVQEKVKELGISLELDGYLFRNGRLLIPESEVLNTEEAAGLLETLYTSLGLAKRDVALNHLSLSEQHYQEGRWSDCIANSRNFLEASLREIAMAYSKRIKSQALTDDIYKTPFKVRQYLKDEGLLDADEKDSLAKIYGLLSGKGSHPYMAQKDQARLLRQLALVLSQFIMVRFDGLLTSKQSYSATYS
ncbi:MAG TPA: hypothetical protein VGE45_00610 [Chloroflexia bacterium]|jgi:hypothetical protein